MAQFRIIGVDKETRDDVERTISAVSAANAKIKAELDGVIVSDVVELTDDQVGKDVQRPQSEKSSDDKGATVLPLPPPSADQGPPIGDADLDLPPTDSRLESEPLSPPDGYLRLDMSRSDAQSIIDEVRAGNTRGLIVDGEWYIHPDDAAGVLVLSSSTNSDKDHVGDREPSTISNPPQPTGEAVPPLAVKPEERYEKRKRGIGAWPWIVLIAVTATLIYGAYDFVNRGSRNPKTPPQNKAEPVPRDEEEPTHQDISDLVDELKPTFPMEEGMVRFESVRQGPSQLRGGKEIHQIIFTVRYLNISADELDTTKFSKILENRKPEQIRKIKAEFAEAVSMNVDITYQYLGKNGQLLGQTTLRSTDLDH